MQLSPTLLCCMSSHPSETLFDHSRPGKTLCLLIEKKNRKNKTNTRMSVRGQFESISYSTHIFVIFLGEAQAEMRKVCSMTKEKAIVIILLE